MLRDLRKVRARAETIDHKIMRRSARIPRAALDRGFKQLTRCADHSKLWLGVATGLALRKGSTRRAAFRGVAAIAVTSAVTNGVAKRLRPVVVPPPGCFLRIAG